MCPKSEGVTCLVINGMENKPTVVLIIMETVEYMRFFFKLGIQIFDKLYSAPQNLDTVLRWKIC